MCCGTWKSGNFSDLGVRIGTPSQKLDTEAKDMLELPSPKKKKKKVGVYFCIRRRELSKQRLGSKKAGDFLRPEEVENV